MVVTAALRQVLDIILHVDKYVDMLIAHFGHWTYAILFLIIFCETGLVVMPFLPGDSLLFVVGAFAARGTLSILLLWALLFGAAVIGDSLNYYIGHHFGKRLSHSRFVKPEHLEKTRAFFHKHGGKTIILARFIPIIRTFAPFVAGIGAMSYGRFFAYNVIGGFLWVTLFLFAGYFFGTIPVIEQNLTLVIFIIIIVSFIPPLHEWWKHRKAQRLASSAPQQPTQ